MLDSAGDEQLFGDKSVQPSYAVYNKDRLLTADDNAESEGDDDEEPIEMEFFGVKMNSKVVSNAVAATDILTKPPSKVTLQLDELTEKVKEALENSNTHKLKKRQRITDLKSGPDEILSVRKENVVKDMQKTRRVPGFEQLKALPTVSRRKQPILNRVSCQENAPLRYT